MPKILIDLTHIHTWNLNKSIPIYTFRLLDAIPNEYISNFILLVNRDIRQYIHNRYPAFKLKTWRVYGIMTKWNWIKDIFIKYSYLLKVCFGKHDKVLILSDLVPYTRYKFWFKKKIVLVHDQKSVEYHKDKARNKYCLDFYHDFLTSSDRIIAISEYTKNEIVRIHKIPSLSINVVYNSVVLPAESEKSQKKLPNEYILFVNTLQPYKNAETLVKAFCKIKDKINQGLVFVGSETEYWTDILLPILKKEKVEDRVVLLQGISNEQLKYCYEHASLFVTTSTKEGFGYTPIEAAICGCPVISSTCEALPEVTDGKVVYYEPYNDSNVLANCILDVVEHPISEIELKSIANYFHIKYSPRNLFDGYKRILFDEQ